MQLLALNLVLLRILSFYTETKMRCRTTVTEHRLMKRSQDSPSPSLGPEINSNSTVDILVLDTAPCLDFYSRQKAFVCQLIIFSQTEFQFTVPPLIEQQVVRPGEDSQRYTKQSKESNEKRLLKYRSTGGERPALNKTAPREK